MPKTPKISVEKSQSPAAYLRYDLVCKPHAESNTDLLAGTTVNCDQLQTGQLISAINLIADITQYQYTALIADCTHTRWPT